LPGGAQQPNGCKSNGTRGCSVRHRRCPCRCRSALGQSSGWKMGRWSDYRAQSDGRDLRGQQGPSEGDRNSMGAQYAANWYADPQVGTSFATTTALAGPSTSRTTDSTPSTLSRRRRRWPSARSSAVRPQRRRFRASPRMPMSWPNGRGLRDSGVISAEDFEAKKRQLLGL
jgi:hypothetical protein